MNVWLHRPLKSAAFNLRHQLNKGAVGVGSESLAAHIEKPCAKGKNSILRSEEEFIGKDIEPEKYTSMFYPSQYFLKYR